MSIVEAEAPALSNDPCRGHQHLVEFYESDDWLARTVAGFLAPALEEGGTAVVVATPAHRAAFDAALAAVGVDVASAAGGGRYLSLDAAELLASFSVEGVPDAHRYFQEVGGLLERLSSAGGPLRIYGEMVALLWEAGDAGSAVALEDLWNDLAATDDFELLCAYRLAGLDNEEDALALRRVCEQHASRPEQTLLAELAYADALTTVINRRRSTEGELGLLTPAQRGDDSLVLAAWRNASELMASPGGRVLGDLVAEEALAPLVDA